MQAFRKAITAFLFCASVTAYAGTRVVIDRGGYTGPLEVRVGVPQEDGEPKWIEGKRIGAESTLELAPLAAGTYIVLVSGLDPLQRFAVRAGVRGEGDETIRVVLPEARPLHGTIRLGNDPAGDAVINFQNKEFGWSTNLSARPDGTFDASVWQGGQYVIIGRGGSLGSPVRRPVRIDGPSITVDLSPLRIAGVVTDAEGAPVPEAKVRLRPEFGRETANIRVLADQHGMFEFADVKQGPYSITVMAEGYLIAGEHSVYVTGETPVEKVGITLNPGVPRSLKIVDAAGRPVPSAVVNVVSDAKLRSTTVTDAEGRATVSIPPSGSSAAWVMPSTGSFAVVRLDASQSADARKVVIPEGSASLTVEVLTPAQGGIPGLGMLMRYNGEVFLPNASTLRTDEKGRMTLTRMPPGRYEFWPFNTAEEAAELMAAQAFSPAPAPITIEAADGESRATVIVEKKQPQRGVAQ